MRQAELGRAGSLSKARTAAGDSLAGGWGTGEEVIFADSLSDRVAHAPHCGYELARAGEATASPNRRRRHRPVCGADRGAGGVVPGQPLMGTVLRVRCRGGLLTVARLYVRSLRQRHPTN